MEASRAPAVRTTGVYGSTLGSAAVRLRPGLLRDWQYRNRTATVPHTLTQLRAAGNLDNFRRLISDSDDSGAAHAAGYRGRYPFLDTDIYKTLEGLVYLLGDPDAGDDHEHDDHDPGEHGRDDHGCAVRAFYEEAVALIAAAQRTDGYLGTYYQGTDAAKEPWSDLSWGHELYNLGHLIQAAVAAHRQLGDARLLEVADRFADLVWDRYGEDGEAAHCGHPEIEMALVELYRETGDPRRLRQAELFVDRRGSGALAHTIFTAEYFQDHQPLREMESVIGHAVRMMYLAAGATDVAIERADGALLAELERLFDDMVATKLYLTGGLGSRHSDEAIGDRYELPGERAYAETCAAIGAMQWAWRLFLATGRSDVLDVYERILYNAFAVGLSADGRAFFYDNPLQRRPDHQQRSGAEAGGELLRRSWFGCPCCPPNVVRWMAELQDHLALADQAAVTLAVITAAEITTAALDLTVATDYPWGGTVTVTIDRAVATPVTLRIRRPAWAADVAVELDGVTAEPTDEHGFLSWKRIWRPGEVLRVALRMPITAVAGHPHLDAVRGTAAVVAGPIVYCLEQPDVDVAVDDVVFAPEMVSAAEPHRGDHDAITEHALDLPVRRAAPAPAVLYPVLATADGVIDGQPDDRSPATAAETTATLIPYHLWGNREPGAMRV